MPTEEGKKEYPKFVYNANGESRLCADKEAHADAKADGFVHESPADAAPSEKKAEKKGKGK